MTRVLIDSSGLIGFADKSSRSRKAISSVIDNMAYEIILPASVIPEASYVIGTRLGYTALLSFVRDLTQNPPPIENLLLSDYERISEVMSIYASLRLDFVDASILALAERLNVTHVLTLDRRDFNVLRPKHCTHLELLP